MRIVVGVDGSDQSITALQEAGRLALLLGARIEAVTIWRYPPQTSADAESLDPSFEEDAKDTLDVALTAAYGDDRPAGLISVVQFGHPAKALVERSAGAQMLVLGSRGLGGIQSLLLGSVSAHCATQAHCPVLIVR